MAIDHLAVPFRFENGRAAVVEQDSEDDIAQSIRILVTTERGSRVEVPDYGIKSPFGEQSTSPITNEVLAAATKWEPRARIDVTSQIDDVDELIRTLSIRVQPA